MADIEGILAFWIGPAAHDPVESDKRSKIWYGGDKKTDQTIGSEFGAALKLAEAGELDNWAETIKGSLALIILLDQFSRNLYRGTAMAYKNDQKAVQLAQQATQTDQHLSLSLIERVFLYHPFHHSESLADQETAVRLFTLLLNDADQSWQKQMRSFADYAKGHRDIVKQFDRFPHRNQVLGRKNTDEENSYLEQNGKRFGQ